MTPLFVSDVIQPPERFDTPAPPVDAWIHPLLVSAARKQKVVTPVGAPQTVEVTTTLPPVALIGAAQAGTGELQVGDSPATDKNGPEA
jgi:hypothetical protein